MKQKAKPFCHRLKKYLLYAIFFLACLPAFGQGSGLITGKVFSADDQQPLPGATVLVKGTNRATITGSNGDFSIQAASGEFLVISFIGFTDSEVAIQSGQTLYEIQLSLSTSDLNEVIVVGYGSQRKADITSAVSVINMDAVGEVPTTNVSRLLQGQAAGVQVRQQSGRPGEEMQITIRGLGSLGAGSQPLFVVDGFPIGNSLGQNLNPADIESISVLKDAASTAIYGARGSNGVVLITTKNAKE